jgi:hypothetical protein
LNLINFWVVQRSFASAVAAAVAVAVAVFVAAGIVVAGLLERLGILFSVEKHIKRRSKH